ncbi:MAG: alpha/beta fold hydrolase [Saonia sp.]
MKKCLTGLFLSLICVAGSAQMGTLIKGKAFNDPIALTTRLILPEKPLKEKPPVLIIVHGSGKNGNWTSYQPMVRCFNNQGIAVVFFDKRGTGESGGEYLDVSIENSREVFDIMSDDVTTVAAWAQQQARIDTTRIGVLGFSEGGWVAPLAAGKSPIIKYSIMISGPMCSVGQEFLYSELIEDTKADPHMPMDSIYERMLALTETGFDPYPYVADMETPSLWLFGEKDESMAVHLSQNRLRTMQEKNLGKPLQYKMYTNANHSLYDVDTKERIPYGEDVRQWILKELY